MQTATTIDSRSPSRRARELAAEITELCAHRYVLEARFLARLREFDQARCWEDLGFASAAHWMNLHCSIGLNAAREKLRVARALEALPKIAGAFAEGRLSYTKVRAMTRIADAANEDYLMMIATHGTAWHVETLVRKYRGVKRLQEHEAGDGPGQQQSLACHYDADGMLVIRCRLPADQGALVVKALEAAMGAAEEDATDPDDDVTAETRVPIHARRADALVEMAERCLSGNRTSSSADRYNVVVHVTAETLQEEAAPVQRCKDVTAETSHVEDGPHVTAETSRRLACDGAIVALLEDGKGVPLSIGRRSRTIPPGMRRALVARDSGCRFPGCTHTRFVDGHHIRHWANGGETSLDNLVLLCRRHHRLVHEGGFACEKKRDGTIVFRNPENEPLPRYAELPCIDSGEDPLALVRRMADTSHIDEHTCGSRWYAGEKIDWGLAVSHLM